MKHSLSYGEYFKCRKNGKDEETMASYELQLVLANSPEIVAPYGFAMTNGSVLLQIVGYPCPEIITHC